MCEIPEVCCHNKPKARKEHKCGECHGIIKKGEIYHMYHGIHDGTPFRAKICTHCEVIVEIFRAEAVDAEDGPAFGELYEYVFESRDKGFIKTFLEIKRMRGAKIPDWMIEREKKLDALQNSQ